CAIELRELLTEHLHVALFDERLEPRDGIVRQDIRELRGSRRARRHSVQEAPDRGTAVLEPRGRVARLRRRRRRRNGLRWRIARRNDGWRDRYRWHRRRWERHLRLRDR